MGEVNDNKTAGALVARPNSRLLFPFVTCEPPLAATQCPASEVFMRRAVRIFVSCAACLVLFCAMASAKNKDKDKSKNTQHQSRMSKVAFWRHRKDGDKNTERAKPLPSKQAQSKPTAQVKPVSAKADTPQNVKPLAKADTSKKEQKPVQHAAVASKHPVSKTSKAKPAKPQTKAPETASLKQ